MYIYKQFILSFGFRKLKLFDNLFYKSYNIVRLTSQFDII